MRESSQSNGSGLTASRPRITADLFWPELERRRKPAAWLPGSRPAERPAVPRAIRPIGPHPLAQAPRPPERRRQVRKAPGAAPDVTVALSELEPTISLTETKPGTCRSDCGNGCGNRVWCDGCRREIRAEALRWIRELNAIRPGQTHELSWGEAWSPHVLLARS